MSDVKRNEFVERLANARLRLSEVDANIRVIEGDINFFEQKGAKTLLTIECGRLDRKRALRVSLVSLISELEQLSGALPLKGGK